MSTSGAFDVDDYSQEIPVAIVDSIAMWRRIFATSNGDERQLLLNAAADLFRTRLVSRTVYPDSAGIVNQVIVDALHEMAITAGIDDDDAQLIFTQAQREDTKPSKPGNGASAIDDGPVPSEDHYGIPAPAAEDSERANRFKIEMLDEIALADDPVELIRGLLPVGPALAVTFGPPKSLKSFLLKHVGLHIAANRPFCGRDVQGGAVVYVTSEGIQGVRRRLIAARRAMGIEGQGVPFALVPTMPNLGAGEADRTALQQAISDALQNIGAPLRMIVIDTMRRAMPGKSENEQKDVSIVVDNCEALARAFGCLVVLVHHSPRSDDQRGSGSNAIDAAADLMWSVVRPDETRRSATATVVRYKDGQEGDTWTFELQPAEIGVDHDGNAIISCSVEVTTEPERRKPVAKVRPLSDAQQRVFDIVLTASIDGVAGLAGEAAPRSARAVTRETIKAYAKRAGWWSDEDEKSSRTRLAARLNELAAKRAIGLTAAHVWPARTP